MPGDDWDLDDTPPTVEDLLERIMAAMDAEEGRTTPRQWPEWPYGGWHDEPLPFA